MTTLTKYSFKQSVIDCYDNFEEIESRGDYYIIKFLKSFLKCVIQKTEEGVQIIYLDSFYAEKDHLQKLLGYATFVIACRLNDGKEFEQIEFNKDGEIISIN